MTENVIKGLIKKAKSFIEGLDEKSYATYTLYGIIHDMEEELRPKHPINNYTNGKHTLLCPVCHAVVCETDNYCSYCGQGIIHYIKYPTKEE